MKQFARSVASTTGFIAPAFHKRRFGPLAGSRNEVQREQRECQRELRKADNRREYNKELRECRKEVNEAKRDYRKDVRSVIPGTVQETIRAGCGDIFPDTGTITAQLPDRCDVSIPPQAARDTAAALRAHPALAHELDWHRATVASMLGQYGAYIRSLESLSQAIDHSADKVRP